MKRNGFSGVTKLFKKPLILLFVFISVISLPTAISLTAVAFRSAIVLAMGIDLDESNNVELSAVINISSTSESLSENTKLLVSKGQTLGDAFKNMHIQYGRPFKLGHTRFVLIGENIAKQNLTQTLDGLVRTNKMRNTVQLLYCDDNLIDFFNVAIALKGSTGIKISDIVCYQQDFSTTMISSNIDSFYRGYLSESGISRLNYISLTNNESEGISPNSEQNPATESSSGGGSSSAGSNDSQNVGDDSESVNSSTSEQAKKQFISNRSELAIFKNGSFKVVLSKELSEGVYWADKNYLPKRLLVEIESKDEFDGSMVSFDVLFKDVRVETFFYKDIPFYDYTIDLTIDINEIISPNYRYVEIHKDIIDKDLKNAVTKYIKEKIANCSKFAKISDLDILELNNTYFLKNHRQYKKYKEKHLYEKNILEETIISSKVEIKVV